MEPAASAWREHLAWFTFPVLMGGFLLATGWGLAAGIDTASWVATLTVANVAVIALLEHGLPRDPAVSFLRDRQSPNDVGHGLLFTFLGRPLAASAAVLVAAGIAALLREAGLKGLWPAGWPFALQLALALVVWTFADYWVHRALHTFEPLWWFHSIHHDADRLHILKSGRLHVGEEVLNFLLKPIPLLLVGAPPEIFVWVGLWTVFDGNLVHSNVNQRFPHFAHYFLPTIQLHAIHHARERHLQDSNYSGSTPVWDLLFGTYHHPARHPVRGYGIEASPVPRGFAAQVLFPFRALARRPTPAQPA